MSKFCTTCGASLEDNATFCTNCGTPQDANNQQNNAAPNGQTPAASAADAVKNTFSGVSFSSVKDSLTMDNIKNITKKPNKNTIIGLCVIAVVVIAVIVLLCVLLLGGGRRATTDRIDYAVGVDALVKRGARVDAGETLMRLHAASRAAADEVLPRALAAVELADESPAPVDLIGEVIR